MGAIAYDETWGVSGAGRLTTVADASGSTSYVYDARGNVVQEQRVVGRVSYTTGYAWSLANRLVQITYPSGRIVSYSRDAMGRIASIAMQSDSSALPMPVASDAAYMPFGPLASLTYGNGLSLGIQFDQDYRPSARAVNGTNGIQSLAYAFDAAGNLTSIADGLDGTRSQSFQYDALDRLTQATGLYGTLSYGYDGVGNRLTRTLSGGVSNFSELYTYAANSNQLQTVVSGGAARTLGYGPTGNLVTDDRGNGVVLGYGYNQNNRLVQIASGGQIRATYQQNFLGQRVVKTTGGTTLHFHYDRVGRLLAESDGQGNPVREYVWLDDMPVAMASGGTVYYIHPDHLGAPQKLTDGGQNLAWDAVLRPFGQTEQLAAWVPNNLRFPGQYFDQESGLHQNGFRDYDPSLGRYIESDPIGLRGGLNGYAYTAGNPINRIDSRGLCFEDACVVESMIVAEFITHVILPAAVAAGVITMSGDTPTAQMSTRDDPESESPDVPSGAQCRPASSQDQNRCEEQYYNIDIPTCRAISKRRGPSAGKRCYASAAERYSACLRGGPLPPLDTWSN